MAACLAAAAAGLWTRPMLGVSAISLGVAVIWVERSTASRAFRAIWYGGVILLCATMVVVLVGRALAGDAP